MSKVTFVLFGCALVMLLALASDVSGRRIPDDLESSASEKHKKYKNGHEAEHHESDHAKKGDQGDKGYESKHGYVNVTFFRTLWWW